MVSIFLFDEEKFLRKGLALFCCCSLFLSALFLMFFSALRMMTFQSPLLLFFVLTSNAA